MFDNLQKLLNIKSEYRFVCAPIAVENDEFLQLEPLFLQSVPVKVGEILEKNGFYFKVVGVKLKDIQLQYIGKTSSKYDYFVTEGEVFENI